MRGYTNETNFILTGGERGSEKEISNSARAFPGFVGLNITSSWTKENGAISPEASCQQNIKTDEQHEHKKKNLRSLKENQPGTDA